MTLYQLKDGTYHLATAQLAEAMKEARARTSDTGRVVRVYRMVFQPITKAVMLALHNNVKPRPYERTELAQFRPGPKRQDGQYVVRKVDLKG